MSILGNDLLLGSGDEGYNLTRSLRFRGSASAYLGRTFTTPTNNKIYTVSAWVKLGKIAALNRLMSTDQTAAPATFMYFDSNANFVFYDWQGGSANYVMTGAPVYRDPSSWYHVVIAVDTTQATDTNRVKVYFNNTQITLTASASGWVPQNTNTGMNSAKAQNIGRSSDGNYFDGYMTEFNFIDGQALTPSSFGETDIITGVWKPKRYAGTYGTNGFYLPFTDNSALTTSSNVGLGKDFSGNGNYWTTNNISITAGVTYDSMTDVPTLTSATAANYCVMNPIDTSGTGSTGISITGGNLNLAGASSDWGAARATFGMTSGKWYWECTRTGASSVMFGIGLNSTTLTYAYTSTSYSYFSTGDKYSNNVSAAYGASFASGDVIGVAFDADAGTLTFYKNNVSQGTAYTGLTSGPYFPLNQNYTTTGTASINFGQRPFAYTPPTGFVALNTYNLPTSTIVKGNTVMDATLYTGTGSASALAVAGPATPDFVWIKRRDVAAGSHALYDKIRGFAKRLYSNATNAEYDYGSAILAPTTTGFNLTTSDSDHNTSGSAYVAWQWQAGQGTTSSNTNGTITSTVSVNASAGFSVVTFTAPNASAPQSFGHGLGVAPAFFTIKARNTTSSWQTYHTSIGATNRLLLNTTDAQTTTSGPWNNTAPTSTVITIGSSFVPDAGATTYVAYCWTPIAGYSAFSSYSGNGSSDGVFVYTGFQPKFIIIKRTDTTGNWTTFDSARDPYNQAGKLLYPNYSNAEETDATQKIDFLSNGFKLRGSNANENASGGTYAYMAFATNPFKQSLAF